MVPRTRTLPEKATRNTLDRHLVTHSLSEIASLNTLDLEFVSVSYFNL
jgi:hypothetical protein